MFVKAKRWFKNGDHPKDESVLVTPDPGSSTQFHPFLSEGKVVRFFRHPSIPANQRCKSCGKVFFVHGWIESKDDPDGYVVCPGDWIVPKQDNEYYPVRDKIFQKNYELIEDDELEEIKNEVL